MTRPTVRTAAFAATFALVTAAALASTPAAVAAPPIRGALYEGPAPKGGRTVSLQVSGDGRRVRRLFFGIAPGCRRAGKILKSASRGFGLRDVKIRDGRFTYRRFIRYPATGGWDETRVEGRFLDGGTRFVGTARAALHNPQTRIRCRSGAVRLRAAVPERALVNGDWAGTTAEGAAARLTITPTGITRMSIAVTTTCGGQPVVRELGPLTRSVSVAADGTFDFQTFDSGNTLVVKGRARRGLVTGTVRASGFLVRPEPDDPDATVPCEGLEVPFEAKPARAGARRAG